MLIDAQTNGQKCESYFTTRYSRPEKKELRKVGLGEVPLQGTEKPTTFFSEQKVKKQTESLTSLSISYIISTRATPYTDMNQYINTAIIILRF